MIVRRYIDFNAPLTAEQEARLDALAAMSDDDINFDDIPALTDEQLSLMKRVNPLPAEERKPA